MAFLISLVSVTIGYTGNLCELDIDSCNDVSVFPCQNGATCYDLPFGLYYCDCPEGFLGNQCEIRTCASSLCAINTTSACLDTASGHSCVCVEGFTGTTCDIDIDECADSPCHNGKCNDLIGEFTCDCFCWIHRANM